MQVIHLVRKILQPKRKKDKTKWPSKSGPSTMRNLEKEHHVDKNQHQPFDLNNLRKEKIQI
jgi:hypothetical protein